MNLLCTFCLDLSVREPGPQLWLSSPLLQAARVVWEDTSILLSKHLLNTFYVPGPVLETQPWANKCRRADGGGTYSRWKQHRVICVVMGGGGQGARGAQRRLLIQHWVSRG